MAEAKKRQRERSTVLFDLIKALTGPEKRYFKIFAQRHVIGEQNNYLKLFDAIESQEEYDEDLLQKKFKKEKFAKQLHRIKNYLYDLILKSLAEFHKAKTISSELRHKIEMVEILYAKGLTGQAQKMLEGTLELAEMYERYQYLPEIYELERRIMNSQFYNGKEENDLEKHFSSYQLSIDNLTDINGNWLKATRLMLFLNQHGPVRDAKALEEIERYFEEHKPETCTVRSFEACNYYYFNYVMYHRLRGEPEIAYSYALKHLNWYQEYSFFIRERLRSYLSLLYNFLGIAISIRKFDDVFDDALAKLERLPEEYANSPHNNIYLKLMHFNALHTIRISYALSSGKFKEGIDIIPEIQNGLAELGEKVEPIILHNFYFSFARLYFMTGQFQKANEYLNKVINSQKVQRTDLYCFAKIIQLLLHFEMKKFDLLEYSVISTYRYLLKRNRLYQVENIILDYIRKTAPTIQNEKDQIIAFRELKKTLEKATKNNPYESRALEYFDLTSWLESKISGKTFASLVEEKLKSEKAKPGVVNDFVGL
jgi:hypothetical protein